MNVPQVIAERLEKHKQQLLAHNATPLLCVGIAHNPAPNKGQFVVTFAGEFTLEETYNLITAMRDDLAGKLGIT